MATKPEPVTRRDKAGKSDPERGIDHGEREDRNRMADEGPKADSVPPAEPEKKASPADWRDNHPAMAGGRNPAPDSAEARFAAQTENDAYGHN